MRNWQVCDPKTVQCWFSCATPAGTFLLVRSTQIGPLCGQDRGAGGVSAWQVACRCGAREVGGDGLQGQRADRRAGVPPAAVNALSWSQMTIVVQSRGRSGKLATTRPTASRDPGSVAAGRITSPLRPSDVSGRATSSSKCSRSCREPSPGLSTLSGAGRLRGHRLLSFSG